MNIFEISLIVVGVLFAVWFFHDVSKAEGMIRTWLAALKK